MDTPLHEIIEDHIYVLWRPDIRMWCARGHRGDYGISYSKEQAIKIGKDAVVTGHGLNWLIIQDAHGQFGIHRDFLKQKPTSQFFQDDVE